MRSLTRGSIVVVLFLLTACGAGLPAGSCSRDRDCGAGEGCVQGACELRPCGGCQPDEACNTSTQRCEPAQGATCVDHSCPGEYPCNGQVCARPCTRDKDCDGGFICNSQTHSCAQCAFDNQCATVAGNPHCDAASGACVQCNADFDCVKLAGHGHFCDAHACKPGCRADADCDSANGETCDLATTPGRCVQCRTSSDCGSGACDGTGHCVECWADTQQIANGFCPPARPECDLGSKRCVQCLAANNQSGADCGYPVQGGRVPGDTETCSAATHACADGCQFDTQCGCQPVRDSSGAIVGLNCAEPIPAFTVDGKTYGAWTVADLKKCDSKATSTRGMAAPTLGGCTQCLTNADCAYTVAGKGGSLNGARCDKRSGVSYEMCIEGCDTDADCPSNKTCHLVAGANDHKCVDCVCDNPGPDGTYCETTLAGGLACPLAGPNNPPNGLDASGNIAQVCDRATLQCRKRRQNELCSDSAQCGDPRDPLLDGCLPASKCILSGSPAVGASTFCDAARKVGRCGTPCDDLQQNMCNAGAGEACPQGSTCKQATYTTDNTPISGAACMSNLCSTQ